MNKIAVLGIGKVGDLAAFLLHECGFEVTGFDRRTPRRKRVYPIKQMDVADAAAIGKGLAGFDAVLSCLPYHLNTAVADAAVAAGIHYFDLTEDVPTTRHIIELSRFVARA